MRALAAATVAGRDAARVERRQARDAGFVDADPGIVVEGAEHVVFERGLRPAAEQPAMRAGDDDRVLRAPGRPARRSRAPRPAGGSAISRNAASSASGGGARRRAVPAAAARRRRGTTGRRRQPSAAASAFAWVMTPRAIMSAPSPMRAVSWPTAAAGMPSSCEVIEPGDPGAVAPDPGIVEDRRGDARAWPRDRRHRRRHARR